MIFEHRAAHRRRQGRDVIVILLRRRARSRRRAAPESRPRRQGWSSRPQRPRAGAGGAGAAAAFPLSSTRAITAPTATVSPALTSCSASTPATGEVTSTLTLSVSSSAIPSSAATASPGFLSQLASVPSVIDSPSGGTSTSVATVFPYSAATAPGRSLAGASPLVEGWPSAAAISAACSARWRLARPVAGEAPASRPA